jgi:hypothetical protein
MSRVVYKLRNKETQLYMESGGTFGKIGKVWANKRNLKLAVGNAKCSFHFSTDNLEVVEYEEAAVYPYKFMD